MQNKMILAYIESVYGSAISDQFEATFIDKGSFDDQNINALMSILMAINEIIHSHVFEDTDALEYYALELNHHINNPK